MRIGIDLDRTLFKTEEFKELYHRKVEGLRYVEEPAPVSNGVYDPEKHADICGIEIEKIWEFFEETDLSDYVYSDIDELKEFESHGIVLVTRGNEKFQKMKAKSSGIGNFFDEIVVVQNEPKDIADIDILVDDSVEEIERAGIPGIVIDRPDEGLEKVKERLKEFET